MQARYLTSAAKPEQLPDHEYQEWAFVGRSNAGKSTLLNALVGCKNLARTSRTPGRTRMVNFFEIGEGQLLVDLPGYGFQQGSHGDSKHWQKLMETYFRRSQLQGSVLLMDVRRTCQADDLYLADWLGRCGELAVVLTKTDKLRSREVSPTFKKRAGELASAGVTEEQIHMVSALKKRGLQGLKNIIGIH